MTPREKLIEKVAEFVELETGLISMERVITAVIDFLQIEVVDNESKAKQADLVECSEGNFGVVLFSDQDGLHCTEYGYCDLDAPIIRRNNNPVINIDNL